MTRLHYVVLWLALSIGLAFPASADVAAAVIGETSRSLGLPCVDPIRNGVEPIVNALEQFHEG